MCFFALFVLLLLAHAHRSVGQMINVTQSNMLSSGTLAANTTYRVNTTLDVAGAIKGSQGTVLMCTTVEICIRVTGTQTLSVSSLLLGFQGNHARTVFFVGSGGRVELTNVAIVPNHSGFTVLGATGEFRATMRDVVARSVFLIAANESRSPQVELHNVSTTSNNAIVMTGGIANANGFFRAWDCEFNGSINTPMIRIVNTSESIAVVREISFERTTFRNGGMELRSRDSGVKFTNVTMSSALASVATVGDVIVVRSNVRSGPQFPSFVIQQARNVRFENVSAEGSRGLVLIVNNIEDLDVTNLDIDATTAVAIEMTNNASITANRSVFQNITSRTCMLLKLNGQVSAITNVTVSNLVGPVSASMAAFTNTTGLTVSNWLVDSSTCGGHVLEFFGNRTAAVTINDVTITNSTVGRIVSISNQLAGSFVLNRTTVLLSKVKKIIDSSANSTTVSVDLTEIANSLFSETAFNFRTDAAVSITNMFVRHSNCSGLFQSEISGTVTLFNLTMLDMRLNNANFYLLSITAATPGLTLRVSKVTVERCSTAISTLFVYHLNGQRGTVNITELSISSARTTAAAIRMSASNNNVTLSNVNFTNIDGALALSPAGSLEVTNMRILRGRAMGIFVGNIANTVQLSNVEISDINMACSNLACPLYVSNVLNALTLLQLTMTRLRCYENSTSNAVAAIYTKTANVVESTFIDNSVPVVYLWQPDAVLFDSCRFEGNSFAGPSVTNVGVLQFQTTGIVNITDSLFLDNAATHGAFAFLSGSVVVSGTRFFNNSGTTTGAIKAQSSASSLVVDRCVFSENRATNGTSGAVSCYQNRVCSISNSDFVGNSVSTDAVGNVASALHVYQDTAALSNLTVIDNRLVVWRGNLSASVYLHFLTSLQMVDTCVCSNLDEVSREVRDVGCLGTRPSGNWSATAMLVTGSDCSAFVNASNCSSSNGCYLRLLPSFHVPPRTATTTRTTTTTTTSTSGSPRPTMMSVDSSDSTTSISSPETNVTTMALSNDASTNVGMIVGIVLGSIAFVALIALFVGFVVFRSKKKRDMKEAAEETSSATPSGREFVSARDEYGSLTDMQTRGGQYNSTFRLLS